jgi:photosystem II stability/assembly factor-like uncharacterized protein
MKTETFTLRKLHAVAIMLLLLVNYNFSFAQNWYQVVSGTHKKINTICFSSSTVGYLGGNDSLLMKTTDGGVTWNQLNYTGVNFLAGGANILNLQFISDMIGFMTVGPYSGSYGTTNGGLTWNQINLAGNHCYNQGLFFFDENNGFIGGSGCFQGELISSVSNQNWLTGTWNVNALDGIAFNADNLITDINFYNTSFGLAVSKSGYVFRTTDGGVNWDSIAPPAPLFPLTSVIIVNDTLAYAGYEATGAGFGLYVSNDAGLTWQFDNNSATFFYPDFYTLHQTNNGHLYSGGKTSLIPFGLIFHASGALTNWVYDQVDMPIFDIASYNDSVVFAVGDSGYIVTNQPQLVTGAKTNLKAQTDFSIYPNPTKNLLFVTSPSIQNIVNVKYKISNTLGQQVKTGTINTSIDISELQAGIYFIEIENNGHWQTKKFVVE